MKTRCKMFCQSVTENIEHNSFKFSPVLGGSKENEDFFKYTPSGILELEVVNKDVKFKVGKEYYIDITEANKD